MSLEFERLPQIKCEVEYVADTATHKIKVTNMQELEKRELSGTRWYLGRIGEYTAAIADNGNLYLAHRPGVMQVANCAPHDFAAAYIANEKALMTAQSEARANAPIPDGYGAW